MCHKTTTLSSDEDKVSTKKKHREYQGLQPKIRSDNQPKTWYNVGPPSYKLVYKAHEYYSYLRIINHSYWSYVRQLSYRKRGPTLYG